MNHTSNDPQPAVAPISRRLRRVPVLSMIAATLLIATACGAASGQVLPEPKVPSSGGHAGSGGSSGSDGHAGSGGSGGHAGSGGSAGGTGGEQGGGSGTTQPGGAVKLSTNATCSVTGDLEGKFTESSQMADYLACVLPSVESWIDASYSGMSHPTAYYFVPAGVSGTDVDCEYDDTDLQYCDTPQSVYLGERAVWKQYHEKGDAAPVLVVAHEVTHHFQHVLNMTPAHVPNEQIRYENQADCGAGTFMNYARQKGWLNVDDDITDLAGSLQAAGEADRTPKSSHGTVQERLSAFDLGYLSTDAHPLTACISFVPETPIINV